VEEGGSKGGKGDEEASRALRIAGSENGCDPESNPIKHQ
jgi:hypothetical protein